MSCSLRRLAPAMLLIGPGLVVAGLIGAELMGPGPGREGP
jgi:hypothetical protein